MLLTKFSRAAEFWWLRVCAEAHLRLAPLSCIIDNSGLRRCAAGVRGALLPPLLTNYHNINCSGREVKRGHQDQPVTVCSGQRHLCPRGR